MTIRKLRKYDNKKTPLTEKQIEDLVNNKYKNSFSHTKEYIKAELKKDPNFKIDKKAIVKQDFIDQYYISRESYQNPVNYDFSLLPDIIYSRTEKVKVICLEKSNTGKIIGEGFTCFKDLVRDKKEIKSYFINSRRFTTIDFINKSKEIYGENTFDYSKVHYINNETHVILKCLVCGKEFKTLPVDHFRRNHKRIGCPECNIANINNNRRIKEKEKFFHKAQEKFGDKFDYSKANYINGHTKILIYCKTCGKWFEQTPADHLKSIYGCFSCGKKQGGKTHIDRASRTFEKKGRKIHGDRFDYSKVEYVNNETEVIIIDTYRDNEEFLIKPQHHLKGYGNPYDSMSFGENCINNYLKNIGVKYTGYETTVHGIQGRIKDYVKIDFIFEHDGSKYWIEYHGMQHYRPGLFKFEKSDLQTNENYIRQVNRDNNVREYAKEHQGEFTYIEIPYTFNSWAKISKVLKAILIDKKKPEDVIKTPKVQPPKDI